MPASDDRRILISKTDPASLVFQPEMIMMTP